MERSFLGTELACFASNPGEWGVRKMEGEKEGREYVIGRLTLKD